ncbi:MAG: S8 family serine peptidase, partial [Bradymonadales bacterium]|nr:S8 family serine peptidase [Bradymonadales bacterium]
MTSKSLALLWLCFTIPLACLLTCHGDETDLATTGNRSVLSAALDEWDAGDALSGGEMELSAESAQTAGQAASPPAGAVTRRHRGVEVAANDLLITFREGTSDAVARAHVHRLGHTVQRRFRLARNPRARANRLYLVSLSPGADLDRAIEAARRHPAVEDAQPNFVYQALWQPDDEYFDLQWAQENAGINTPYTLWGLAGPDQWVQDADMDANAARDLLDSMTIGEVVVAIIDSGADLAHPDLANRLWVGPGGIHGYDFVSDDDDPTDENGHGTHCAGIVGALANNTIGVAGTAYNVQLMILRFLDASGSGYTSDAISAVYYAIDNGADILSNSWGGGGYDAAMVDAIGQAMNAGLLFVAAAGNEATDNDSTPHYPSSYDLDNVISVAASTPWRDLAEFSNWGRNSVHLAAPGDLIISTTPTSSTDGIPEASYQIAMDYGYEGLIPWSGTSMSTPGVSGAAAILFGAGAELWPDWLSKSPTERMLAVRQRMFDRAERWPTFSGLTATEGHVNLADLLEDDAIVPAAVGGSLQLTIAGPDFVTLRCIASGDDGTTGRANYYDVRYQQGSTLDFETATCVTGIWTPSSAGTWDSLYVGGLAPNTDYTIGVRVVDNAGNASTVSQINVTTASVTSFFEDDMESGTNGWTSTTWGRTTSQSHSPSYAWTDSPSGLYPNRSTRDLISPEIITGGSAVSLSFWHRHEIEQGYDFGYVQARAYNGSSWGSWTTFLNFTGNQYTWTQVTAELPVTGQRIQLKFSLVTDKSVQADGWYIDDVQLFGGAPIDVAHFEDYFQNPEGTADDCSQWEMAGQWGCETQTLSDSPGANYSVNSRASATLINPLSFSGVEAAQVTFRFVSFSYETNYDFLYFEYSLDRINWRIIDSYTGSQSGTLTYPLSHLAGQPQVWFRFRTSSDYAYQYAGARIDDLVVMVREYAAGCTSDTECDDGLYCNGAETCDLGTGVCQPGTAVDCSAFDGPCNAGVCNEDLDLCEGQPANEGGTCDDGDLCTVDDICTAGVCGGHDV